MAEKIPHTAENLLEPPSGEHLLPTAEQAEPLRKGEKDPAQAAEEARAAVHETAQAADEANPVEQLQAAEEATKPAVPLQITPELRKATLNRELKAIRRRLNAPQRTFSKVVHQPAVRAVSEPVGKTVSRPSGLLGGGIMAFAGSTAYLYLTRHAGMHYSYFVFLGLLLAGFVIGVFLEFGLAALRSARHR